MTGLKSGAGDDLWGDDSEEDPAEDPNTDAEKMEEDSAETGTPTEGQEAAEGGSSAQQPYIVRRAIQDKSVQFEREERLTFFVHEDVANGERELVTEIESTLGRDVPKFDVREAVYRAALRNRDDVLDELLKMGYSIDED
jgi:hypothetical protein